MPHDPYRKTPTVADIKRNRAAEQAARAANAVGRKTALRIIERWNAERSPLWSPTVGCAITAGTPWLDVYCPGCRTSRAIDVRMLDHRQPCGRLAVLMVPGRRARARAHRIARAPLAARWSRKRTPMEFLHGRPLSPEELEIIRRQIEQFEVIGAVDDEIRGIVARNWPHLLSKLPPEED
jgi:hypothetical protein